MDDARLARIEARLDQLVEMVGQFYEQQVLTNERCALVPYEEDDRGAGVFGCLKGSLTMHGDIVAPVGAHWEAG